MRHESTFQGGSVSVYAGSNGRYYGDRDIWERLESGEWRPCCWNPETGTEWIETEAGELLVLEEIPRNELPESLALSQEEDGVSIETPSPTP